MGKLLVEEKEGTGKGSDEGGEKRGGEWRRKKRGPDLVFGSEMKLLSGRHQKKKAVKRRRERGGKIR